MIVHESLLDHFSEMIDEFVSGNNRIMREIDEVFKCELNDLSSSLKIFNDEYNLFKDAELKEEIKYISEKIMNLKATHSAKYNERFNRELDSLKKQMCSFFNDKLISKQECKKKLSNEIKGTVDKLCDFGMLSFDEDIGDEMYNFKVRLESSSVNSEYSKDDLNKLIRSSKHCLQQKLRDHMLNSINEKQEIVSRYASKAYEIVDHYKIMKR